MGERGLGLPSLQSSKSRQDTKRNWLAIADGATRARRRSLENLGNRSTRCPLVGVSRAVWCRTSHLGRSQRVKRTTNFSLESRHVHDTSYRIGRTTRRWRTARGIDHRDARNSSLRRIANRVVPGHHRRSSSCDNISQKEQRFANSNRLGVFRLRAERTHQSITILGNRTNQTSWC